MAIQKHKKIKVLIVDDSPIARRLLQKSLEMSADMDVVGIACDGVEALELIDKTHPDVVCTDYHMPRMDGLELIQKIMERTPLPILVISVSVFKEHNEDNIFKLLSAGAIDVFPKPRGGIDADFEKTSRDLVQKVRVLSGVEVTRKYLNRSLLAPKPLSTACLDQDLAENVRQHLIGRKVNVIGIGSSTGGPHALYQILQGLPPMFPIPIICIQHMSEGFLQNFIDWLGRACRLTVKIAEEGERPIKGTIYFAPEERDLILDDSHKFRIVDGQNDNFYHPSVTTTFHSLAERYGNAAVTILLTGMGNDGATGMRDVMTSGGTTIAQDQASCVVFGMPKAAIEMGAAQFTLPLDEIALSLNSVLLNNA